MWCTWTRTNALIPFSLLIDFCVPKCFIDFCVPKCFQAGASLEHPSIIDAMCNSLYPIKSELLAAHLLIGALAILCSA